MPPKGTTLSNAAKDKIKVARSNQVHPRLVARGLTMEDIQKALSDGLRWCSGACKAFVPRDRFSSDRSGKCRNCVARKVSGIRDRWTPEQRAQNASNISAWRIKEADHVRRAWLKKKYGVTPEWYEEQLARQGGHCALCPAVVDERKLAAHCIQEKRHYLLVDHDHETGRVRGLLCAKCNTALHRVESVSDWAAKALAYLGRI